MHMIEFDLDLRMYITDYVCKDLTTCTCACVCVPESGARGEGRGAGGEGRGVRTQHASTACKLDVDTLFDTLFEASALSQTPPPPPCFLSEQRGRG